MTQFPPPQAVSISIATSADGASVRQGEVVTITWQSTGAPERSTVVLAAQKTVTGHIFSPIATSLPVSGSYAWKIPVFVPRPVPCAVDPTGGCVNDMNPNTTYRIIVTVSVPAEAPALPLTLASAKSQAFTMLGHE